MQPPFLIPQWPGLCEELPATVSTHRHRQTERGEPQQQQQEPEHSGGFTGAHAEEYGTYVSRKVGKCAENGDAVYVTPAVSLPNPEPHPRYGITDEVQCCRGGKWLPSSQGGWRR